MKSSKETDKKITYEYTVILSQIERDEILKELYNVISSGSHPTLTILYNKLYI